MTELDNVGFIRPPEAPVYRPTLEEFKDPIQYLESIRAEAELFGICKIIPPRCWEPPFNPDPDDFRFKPRVQQLNKLEANTRLEVQWIEKLQMYWSMIGKLDIPVINGHPLDLYALNKLTGDTMSDDMNHWESVGSKLGLEMDYAVAFALEAAYTDIILPMNQFLSSLSTADEDITDEKENCQKSTNGPRSNAKRTKFSEQKINVGETKVIRCIVSGKCPTCTKVVLEPGTFVKCSSCQNIFHIPCVDPEPKGNPNNWDWNCKSCAIVKLSYVNQLNFGFQDASDTFSLSDFGEYANFFKSEYFSDFSTMDQMDVPDVPLEKVESTFWELVGSADSEVKVMYGADLHALSHGSGFPTNSNGYKQDENDPTRKKYVECGWNLNNLPGSPSSLLKFIKGDVSGMKVPWMYVGMVFSSFCWHNEDHWTYSINYLHWGEAKTWYGVSGLHADQFEARMKEIVPKLFQCQPDLLHQLVTLLNPMLLISGGVNVYRLDQKAGEFVVTFPRAYHAGFNQGFNFAEAVNFATTSWLPYGLSSIAHYADKKRQCVFSHEEMLCEMASQISTLEMDLALEVHKQLSARFTEEKKNRATLSKLGVKPERRIRFEDLEDDERSCWNCNTTMYFSSVSCTCLPTRGKRVCIRHYLSLCGCPIRKRVLHYRFTTGELDNIIKNLLRHISRHS